MRDYQHGSAAENQTAAMQHLIRHHSSWVEEPKNIASLDELVRVHQAQKEGHYCRYWPEGAEKMRPATLLRKMREMELQSEIGPDQIYSHLKRLPDTGDLRVLRSKYEIAKVGRQLKNCALNYAPDVRDGECLLVVLAKRRRGNSSSSSEPPFALGMMRLDGSFSVDSCWKQIYLACNEWAPEDVKNLFYDYTDTVRTWYDDIYNKTRE